MELLHIFQSVWSNQAQLIVILLERLSKQGLLDPEAIVRWAYSPQMTEPLTGSASITSTVSASSLDAACAIGSQTSAFRQGYGCLDERAGGSAADGAEGITGSDGGKGVGKNVVGESGSIRSTSKTLASMPASASGNIVDPPDAYTKAHAKPRILE
ncbi:unnamed protein product [Protopolystoma xenopodis]|uniref:MIF4G-like type 2 domain-containing protein n=1 Tax=Protopolystoma xenopodis TaxID=117903 RepID=A0A3S5CMV7_9PLAT|nr:unnamed protein product [Protopolystoma xenopodis]